MLPQIISEPYSRWCNYCSHLGSSHGTMLVLLLEYRHVWYIALGSSYQFSWKIPQMIY